MHDADEESERRAHDCAGTPAPDIPLGWDEPDNRQ
jgi:hypothetical protein